MVTVICCNLKSYAYSQNEQRFSHFLAAKEDDRNNAASVASGVSDSVEWDLRRIE